MKAPAKTPLAGIFLRQNLSREPGPKTEASCILFANILVKMFVAAILSEISLAFLKKSSGFGIKINLTS